MSGSGWAVFAFQVVVAVVLGWVFRARTGDPNSPFLVHGTPVRVLAVVLLGVAFVGVAVFLQEPPAGSRVPGLVAAASILVIGVHLVLETLLVRIHLGQSHLEIIYPWWRVRRVPWGAIREFSQSNWTKYCSIHTEGYGKLHLPNLPGIERVFERVDRRWNSAAIQARRQPKQRRLGLRRKRR